MAVYATDPWLLKLQTLLYWNSGHLFVIVVVVSGRKDGDLNYVSHCDLISWKPMQPWAAYNTFRLKSSPVLYLKICGIKAV